MKTAIVTGSSGLIGSEAARRLVREGFRVIGIHNDMRAQFFGAKASTKFVRDQLVKELEGYTHSDIDIRDADAVYGVFREYGRDLELIVHAAAQPSHDWAASDPVTDFDVNARGTLLLLEATRNHAAEATFAFLSTNKVYGDTPNALPLIEGELRYDLPRDHVYAKGIDETMSLDQCTHSLFGVSKAAADLMVQEYGRYFDMKTACFRGGCLTGPAHAGTQLHGFLSYLMRCAVSGEPYTVFGYKGKQVRDNIHSHDLVAALLAFHDAPRVGEAYNMGGGRGNDCSMMEAIRLCEELTDRRIDWSYAEQNRTGDHIWWVTDTSRFEEHYPNWRREYDLRGTLTEIRDAFMARS